MMKNLMLLCLVATLPLLSLAQNRPVKTAPPPPPVHSSKMVDGREIFRTVEDNPLYPGCEAEPIDSLRKRCSDEKMLSFIYNNLQYPEEALAKKIEGMVVVQFIVEVDGSITGGKIIRDIGGGCGAEALRLVNAMPNWIPGKQDGVAVPVQFNLPVKFKIGGKLPDKLNPAGDGKVGASPVSEGPAALLGYNPAPGQPGVIQIKYATKVKGQVRLQILDKAGNILRTLVDEFKERGSYTFEFDPAAQYLDTGEYQYRLEAGDAVFTKPIQW